MKKVLLVLSLISIVILSCACSDKAANSSPTAQEATVAGTSAAETKQPTPAATEQATAVPVTSAPETEQNNQTPSQSDEQSENQEEPPQEDGDMTLQMTIGNTPVTVEWEDNDAVAALKGLCKNQPLTINTSMYGGFEQVGAIGANLPQSDVQTTTSSGDIVLYSGNQLVVFYGSNTWAYTRLGHITDQSAEGMNDLLSNGDTVITINLI